MVKSALGATRGGKRTAGIVVAVVAVAVIIFGGGAYLFTQLFTGQIRQVGQMQTMQLTASSYAPKVEASGSFRAASSSAVSPEVDGTINDVKVKSGDAVKKGDVLFTIDNAQISQEANAAKTAYDEASAALTTANSALESANSKLKSAQDARDAAKSAAETRDAAEAARQQRDQQSSTTQKQSAARQGAVVVPVTSASGSSFDSTAYDAAINDAQSEVDKAQSQVDTAKKTADAAKTTYDTAAAKAEKLTVTAPSDGTVVDLKVQKGMTSQAVNSQGAALQIADLSTLTAVVTVPASQIATISTGLKATITSSSLPDQTIGATVSKVGDAPVAASTSTNSGSTNSGSSTGNSTATNSNATQTSARTQAAQRTASAASGSNSSSNSSSGSSSSSSSGSGQSSQDSSTSYYEVTLTLDKADNAKVGMEVSAAIELKEYSTVYYVPSKAVSQSGSYAYVEVVYNDNTTKQHQVQILDTTDDGQLIIQGSTITEGQRILTEIS